MAIEIIQDLKKLLGEANVITNEALQDRYTHIWKMHVPLQAKGVVLPTCTEDVAQIMKICSRYKQPVVVHGGLTNLVGSTETNGSELVISMERMNHVEEIDPISRTLTVQSGVILEHVQSLAAEHQLLFPLNYGAKGSAQIGGAISTNAGGLRVLRFGMMRNLVLGLEAVLPDGTIISNMKKIIKDNSAYDIKQLFIGSEGTLGIVTRAVLKLVEAPKSRISALIGLESYAHVTAFFKYMDAGLGGTLSAFELIWPSTYRAMTTPPTSIKPPLPYTYNYYVLIESLGSHPETDATTFEHLLSEAMESMQIQDAVLAQSAADLNWFWQMREDVAPMASVFNHLQSFDISLPIPLIGEAIDQMVEALSEIPAVEAALPFGHVADGNIHFLIGKNEASPIIDHQINEIVYRPLQAIGGSVSAEHGIGMDKKAYLRYCRSEAEINLMKMIKKTMDPLNLLNRGKVLDIQ